jgi:hypothetical protein
MMVCKYLDEEDCTCDIYGRPCYVVIDSGNCEFTEGVTRSYYIQEIINDDKKLIFNIETYTPDGTKESYTEQMVLDKQNLIKDFMYKSLSTPMLQTMKTKIEKELQRRS